MINTNELRLGNKVLYRGEIDTVTEIGIGNGYCRNNGYFNDDKGYVEPIPLSPDILQACGFVWTANIHRWVHGCGYRVIQHDHGFDNGIGDASFSQPPLKHLHQLQNLFFALTGTELTVNPDKVKV